MDANCENQKNVKGLFPSQLNVECNILSRCYGLMIRRPPSRVFFAKNIVQRAVCISNPMIAMISSTNLDK